MCNVHLPGLRIVVPAHEDDLEAFAKARQAVITTLAMAMDIQIEIW